MSAVDTMPASGELLYSGADWNFESIDRVYAAIDEIARDELRLDLYPTQIEVITSEQMLDAYSSIGMPLMYRHWSFGKRLLQDESLYRRGARGLAYEIVINSNPCICYIMEENTMTMQTLVIAHAAFGHNHFFKNNHLFRQWTDASGIIDYLAFAKRFIADCEVQHGSAAVERVLDAAHALMGQGVHRYPKARVLDLKRERKRDLDRRQHEEETYNDLWRTVPGQPGAVRGLDTLAKRRQALNLPEENLLYFLEKRAPKLQPWQREILRIVRMLAQYFYPQRQTKMMNEGAATYTHYRIMNRLYEQGRITDGSMLEFLHAHTSVVFQPEFDDPRYSGLNPYALGFAMMEDIARIADDPSDEDREWFPEFAGRGEAIEVLKDAWANYRDESFVLQYLSPRLIRRMRLFKIEDDAEQPHLLVDSIHDERGYRAVRSALARQYDVARIDPDIQIVDVDLAGERKLILQHRVEDGILLEVNDARAVLHHLADLWGYPVELVEIDAASDAVLKRHDEVGPRRDIC
jgi:stage V sporulation protein R